MIGISVIYPDSQNLNDFYKNLKNGVDSVKEIPSERIKNSVMDRNVNYRIMSVLERVDKFDYSYFGISKNDAILMDPQERLLLQETVHCIDNAGYKTSYFQGKKASVYVSSIDTRYTEQAKTYINNPDYVASKANVAGRLSYCLDLRGAAINIDTACSSSLISVIEACKELQLGYSDYAFVCASSIYFDFYNNGFEYQIFSKDGKCKTFDKSADGIGVGEGVAVVLLKPLEDAVRDKDNIHAVIKGFASNQDGKQAIGLTAPSPDAQTELLKEAWKSSGVDPEDISFIEAHGTGTKLGDPVEISGITNAFRQFTDKKQFCAVSAVKANLGHLDMAAGISSLVKTVLQLKYKEFFPSINFYEANEYIDFQTSPVYVNTKLQKWTVAPGKKRIAGVSSFGIIGTNAHVILEEYPQETEESSYDLNILKISSKTSANLVKYSRMILEEFKSNANNINNLSYTFNTCRDDYKYRYAITWSNLDELYEKLKTVDNNKFFVKKYDSPVFLLLSPDITISEAKLKELTGENEVFQTVFDSCVKLKDSSILKNKNIRVFIYHLSIYKALSKLGISIYKVLGTSFMNFLNHHIFGDKGLEECLNEILEEKFETRFNSEKFRAFITKALTDNKPVFIGMSFTSTLEKEVVKIDKDCLLIQKRTILDTVADLYNHGIDVNWDFLSSNFGDYKKTETIPYLFDEERCWFKDTESVKVDDWLFDMRWKEDPLQNSTRNKPAKNFIVFSDKNGYSEAFLQNLNDSNINYIFVNDSSKFKKINSISYEINYSKESDYSLLLDHIKSDNIHIDSLLHFANCNSIKEESYDSIDEALRNGVYSQFLFAKTFKELLLEGFEFYFISTNSMSSIKGAKSSPAKSMSNGFIRALLAEFKNIEAKSINFNMSKNDFYHLLMSEILSDNRQVIVNYENGKRYTQEMYMLNEERPSSHEFLKDSGTYIITGGASGIGLELCHEISKTKNCNLIILGRKELIIKKADEWAAWLEENKSHEQFQLISNLDNLLKSGANVEYHSCDVSRKNSLLNVLNKIKVRYKINGLIHSAAIPGRRKISRSDLNEFREVISSRVHGSLLLFEELKSENLDFMVFFSSLSSILPAFPRKADYASACVFIDEFIRQSKLDKTLLKVINWSDWTETGMSYRVAEALGSDGKESFKTKGAFLHLKNIEGVEAFNRSMLGLNSNYYVMAHPEKFSSEIMKDFLPYFDIELSLKKNFKQRDLTSANNSRTSAKKDDVYLIYQNTTLEQLMLEIWKKILGNEDIDLYDNFFEIGGHSQHTVKFAHELNTKLKIDFDAVELFAHPSIVELSHYLLTEFPEIAVYFKATNSVDTKKRKRGAEKII